MGIPVIVEAVDGNGDRHGGRVDTPVVHVEGEGIGAR
mgnify:CR=1 FL=1